MNSDAYRVTAGCVYYCEWVRLCQLIVSMSEQPRQGRRLTSQCQEIVSNVLTFFKQDASDGFIFPIRTNAIIRTFSAQLFNEVDCSEQMYHFNIV